MSERECFTRCIEHLTLASHCLRGLAQLRGDMQWLLPVRLLDEMVDRIKALMTRGGPSLLILPDRRR